MEQYPLSVTRRDVTGKGHCRSLRAQGMIPAVIYGKGQEAENLAVAQKELESLLRKVTGSMAYLALEVEGAKESRAALLQELQTDYLGRKLLHLDFYEIKADQELTVEVPLDFTGEAPGAALGGVVATAEHSIVLKGVAANIPDSLNVDISGLELNATMHAQELALPEGVSLVSEENFLVVSCNEPAAADVADEEEAEGEEAEAEAASDE